MARRIKEALEIWERLDDVCINDEGEIDADFQATDNKTFGAGEEVTVIWHWLEETYEVAIAVDLMGI